MARPIAKCDACGEELPMDPCPCGTCGKWEIPKGWSQLWGEDVFLTACDRDPCLLKVAEDNDVGLPPELQPGPASTH